MDAWICSKSDRVLLTKYEPSEGIWIVRVMRSEKSETPVDAIGSSKGRKFSCFERWLLTKKKMMSRNVTSIMGVKLIETPRLPG
jgi:hypothetical protein